MTTTENQDSDSDWICDSCGEAGYGAMPKICAACGKETDLYD